MTGARTLATYFTQVRYTDLPPQALQHAARLIASTAAREAGDSGIACSKITRDLGKERAGTSDASIWFDSGSPICR